MRDITNEEEDKLRELEAAARNLRDAAARVQRRVIRAAGVERTAGDPSSMKISTAGGVYNGGEEPLAQLSEQDYNVLCRAFEAAEVAHDDAQEYRDELLAECGVPSYALIGPNGEWVNPKDREPLIKKDDDGAGA